MSAPLSLPPGWSDFEVNTATLTGTVELIDVAQQLGPDDMFLTTVPPDERWYLQRLMFMLDGAGQYGHPGVELLPYDPNDGQAQWSATLYTGTTWTTRNQLDRITADVPFAAADYSQPVLLEAASDLTVRVGLVDLANQLPNDGSGLVYQPIAVTLQYLRQKQS